MVQRLVCHLDASVGSKTVVVFGDTQRNRDLDGEVGVADGHLLDLLAETFGDDGRPFQIRLGEKCQEFFATVAREYVVLAKQATDRLCDRFQDNVTAGVAVGVVDVLEVVNVDKDKAERLVGALYASDFVRNRLVHVAAVRESRQLVGLGNQVKFLVGFFQVLGAFADFLFQNIPMGIQLADLALDGAVHDVERLAQLTDFVVACSDINFLDVHVTLGNLLDVQDKLVHRNAQDVEHPCSDNQDDEDRNNQDRDACLRGRRNQLVDFTLGLEGNEGEVVVGIVVDIQQVGFAVVQLEELRLVKRVVTRVDVFQSQFGNLVDVGHPFLQIRVVENFSVSVDSD